jgi:L-serine dehydratase
MRAARLFAVRLEHEGHLPATARVCAQLYGSLGATGKGHGSDRAVLLGLEGEQPAQAEVAYRERCLHAAILGNAAPAVADCNHALQLQPKDGLARAYRGYAHLRGGESDGAIAD